MSVYIKGMEMPKNCGTCFMRVGGCKQRMYIEHRPKGCPLIELLPHGRLIDADKMRESIRRQTGLLKLMGGDLSKIAETLEKGFLQEIDNAPTIIEAEEGE